jgi:hypothetical protein
LLRKHVRLSRTLSKILVRLVDRAVARHRGSARKAPKSDLHG